MKTKNYLVITLAATLAVGGFASINARAAEESAVAQRPLQGSLLVRAKEKLGLTDEQVAEIRAALQSERSSMKDLGSRLREARTELRAAIRSTDATEQSVRAAAARLADVQADAAVERMILHAKISPILTAEQREKIAQLQSRLNEARKSAMNRIARRLSQ